MTHIPKIKPGSSLSLLALNQHTGKNTDLNSNRLVCTLSGIIQRRKRGKRARKNTTHGQIYGFDSNFLFTLHICRK
jgi:hypothetical protein